MAVGKHTAACFTHHGVLKCGLPVLKMNRRVVIPEVRAPISYPSRGCLRFILYGFYLTSPAAPVCLSILEPR